MFLLENLPKFKLLGGNINEKEVNELAGRPRALSSQSKKNYTKAELEQKQEEESLLEAFPKIPIKPPAGMTGVAEKEYERISGSLAMLPIADLDLGQVIAYCEFYADFIAASKIVKKEGVVVDGRINPAFNAKEKAHQRMQSIARTIGMTIDSRLKIVTPKVESERDPFDEYFDG